MSPGPPWGGGDWVGATFGDPRTPEKAQRRLGGLPIKKKKKKTLFFDAEKKLLLGNFEENSFVKRARVLASTQIGARSHTVTEKPP